MRWMAILALLHGIAYGAPVQSVTSAPTVGAACKPSTDGRVQINNSDGKSYCCNGTVGAETWKNCTVVSGGTSGNLQTNDGSGAFGAYAGTSCTNQFPRSINGSGAATCASVALGTDATGTLSIANGGVGQTTINADEVYVGTGTGTLHRTPMSNCNGSSDKVIYNSSTHSFGCGTDNTTQGVTQPAWTSVSSYSNSWVACGVAGDVATRYKKDTNGVVWIQACIKSGTLNTTAFTLPGGYRPSGSLYWKGTNGSADFLWKIDGSGNVVPVATAAGGDGNVRGAFAFPADNTVVVSVSPASAYGYCTGSGSCSVTTNSVTCSATGGSGVYSTYAWSYVSGTTATVTTPSAASTTFSRTKTGSIYYVLNGTYRCTVTDNAGASGYFDINVQTEHDLY